MILTVVIESRWKEGKPKELTFDTRSDLARYEIGSDPVAVAHHFAGEYCDDGSVFVRNGKGETLAKVVRGRLYE